MIKSVLYRHGVDDLSAKQHVTSRLDAIEMHSANVSRIKVVLDRVGESNRARNYLCHISLRVHGGGGVEIYTDKNQPRLAIDDAFDRAQFALSGRHGKRLRKCKRT